MSTLSPSSVVLSLLLRERREAQAVFDAALSRLNNAAAAVEWFERVERRDGEAQADKLAVSARAAAMAAKAERIRAGKLADAAAGRDEFGRDVSPIVPIVPVSGPKRKVA